MNSRTLSLQGHHATLDEECLLSPPRKAKD
ncbi:hypothetical protein CEXT_3451, partial [Caerostris extrusa]